MAAKSIGCDLNLKFIDIFCDEQKKEDFLKVSKKVVIFIVTKSHYSINFQINPQHTVPTLDDDGFILSESRAIIAYLFDKHAKDESLYPKDLQARAIVNQRIQFDVGTLYKRFLDLCDFKYDRKLPDYSWVLPSMDEAAKILDTFLVKNKYVAGENPTLADFSILASVISYEAGGIDITKYPNVNRWYEMCKETIPGYQCIQTEIAEMKKYM
jgi:glutathione S-transferase